VNDADERADERARIVRWLQERADETDSSRRMALLRLTRRIQENEHGRIERGEHRREETK
jgi:hypothetical protein